MTDTETFLILEMCSGPWPVYGLSRKWSHKAAMGWAKMLRAQGKRVELRRSVDYLRKCGLDVTPVQREEEVAPGRTTDGRRMVTKTSFGDRTGD